MAKYTVIIETEDGRTLKVDGALIDQEAIPLDGGIIRFKAKRIIEVNSHHPYYLTLFCHILLNRQVQDGWVNQRDFDATLVEVLDSPLEPFRQIWDQASWVERAVLTGMAAMQGRHGPITQQEIIRYLQQQNRAVPPNVVVQSLDALSERGVLVPMGAISYRFAWTVKPNPKAIKPQSVPLLPLYREKGVRHLAGDAAFCGR